MKNTKRNENKVCDSKKEVLEHINRYLDSVANYIDNLIIIDYEANNLPIYSRPKFDDMTILRFEEIPFINSVQESLDSYWHNHGNILILKYDYKHLYMEPKNKYIYKDYIEQIPHGGWEWPYTSFDDFNQLFVSEQEGYVYNKL